jgi:murein DD-endopeptidase MepM/ murein hydrolase activator NlpD
VVLLAGLLLAALPAEAPADQADVDAARARAQDASAAYSAAETTIGQLEDEVGRLRHDVDRTQASFDQVAKSVSQLAVNRYVKAGSDLDLFATQDVNRQAAAAALTRMITNERDDAADRYRALREDLSRQQKELNSRLGEQQQALADIEKRRADLLAELSRLEEAERQAEAARQAAAEQARRDEAARAAASADATSVGSSSGGSSSGGSDSSGSVGASSSGDAGRSAPSIRSGGGVVCPVAGSSAFSDTWGDSRSGGRRHLGVDMFANYGTPVVATEGGDASDNTGGAGGIAIVLQGDSGVQYYYAHLEEIATLGRVEAGQVIGYVGDTGNAAGTPHLHIQIQPGGWGTDIDPYPTIAAAC